MKTKHHHVKESNRILRLNPEEITDPNLVVVDFFMNYHLKDVREAMWEWLSAGLTSSNEYFNTGRERSNLLFLYENIEKLIEAVYLQKRRADRRAKKLNKKALLSNCTKSAMNQP